MVYFVGVINIIPPTINLDENYWSASINLTKMTVLYQFFKSEDQIKTRNYLRTNLTFLDKNIDQKIN